MDCIRVFTFYLWSFFLHLTFEWVVGGVFFSPVSVCSSMAEQVLPWRGRVLCPWKYLSWIRRTSTKKYGTIRSLRYIYSNPFRFLISSLGSPNFPSQKPERDCWRNMPLTTAHQPDRIVTRNKLLHFYRDILNFCILLFIYILIPNPLFYWSVQQFDVTQLTQDGEQSLFTIKTNMPIPMVVYGDIFQWVKYGHLILPSNLDLKSNDKAGLHRTFWKCLIDFLHTKLDGKSIIHLESSY